MGGSENCNAVLGDRGGVCDYRDLSRGSRRHRMSKGDDLVKNLLMAAVGILLAISLVMLLASALMDMRWV